MIVGSPVGILDDDCNISRSLKFLVSFIIGFLSKCYYDGLSFYTKRDNKAFQLRHRTRTSKRDCLVLCGQQMDGRVQNKSPKEKMS